MQRKAEIWAAAEAPSLPLKLLLSSLIVSVWRPLFKSIHASAFEAQKKLVYKLSAQAPKGFSSYCFRPLNKLFGGVHQLAWIAYAPSLKTENNRMAFSPPSSFSRPFLVAVHLTIVRVGCQTSQVCFCTDTRKKKVVCNKRRIQPPKMEIEDDYSFAFAQKTEALSCLQNLNLNKDRKCLYGFKALTIAK